MAGKRVLFEAAAHEKLLRGTTALSDAVAVTLGPKAQCVIIQRSWGTPLVCNDGVTIAREMQLEDPEENLGVQMLRQAADRTGDAVGDGTSTATLLAQRLFAEGLRNVAAGASAIDVRRGIERGLTAVVGALREQSRPVRGRAEMAQAATIAAHNDPAIGALVAEAIDRVGPDGAVTVEEARGIKTELELVEGLQFDRGWLSPYFVTAAESMEAVLHEPRLLLTDRRISQAADLVRVMETCAREGRPLLIVADEVDGDALATLVVNKLRGVLATCAVKAPGFGDRRRDALEDIAVLCGGSVASEQLGVKLDQLGAERLGSARRVVVARDSTTIVGGAGARAAIDARVASVKREIEAATSDYDRDKLRERLARLSGGVAVLRVGAPSEAEMKNRKEAFEDAVASTRAAVAEGLVPGGGLALVRAASVLVPLEAAADGDERTGLRILRRALEEPARQIATNSGADAGVVIERMRAAQGSTGFDAARNVFVDLVEAGIVDPTKVVRVALENAVSVAGVLLLCRATLTEKPREVQRREPPPAGDDA